MKKRELRRGITTGTCAAAGAKVAALALFRHDSRAIKSVSVTLPSGVSKDVAVFSVKVVGAKATAIVIKDAGDDPDATNGAHIVACVELVQGTVKRATIRVRGGVGVGVVTKQGLKIRPGRPAINPVPLKMIRLAIREAAASVNVVPNVIVTISVPEGERIALKTMNARLGILGGISILGTTGIVEPLSLIAYRQSISSAISVAMAQKCDQVVFSTGRSTEKVAEKALKGFLPEAFILTGDHMGYALKEAAKKGVRRATIAGQFAKMSKLAGGHFETHCSDADVELDFIAGLCAKRGAKRGVIDAIRKANTAREAYFVIERAGLDKVFDDICALTIVEAKKIAGVGRIELDATLVGYEGTVRATWE